MSTCSSTSGRGKSAGLRRLKKLLTWTGLLLDGLGRSLTRTIILKLATRNHGREGVAAGHDFLLEIVVLQRIWSDVACRLTLGDILVAQLLHIVELVCEQQQGAAIGVGRSGNGGEPEAGPGLVPEGGAPIFAD